jgi:hypothetical protein
MDRRMTFEQWYQEWCQASVSDRCEMDVMSTARAAWEFSSEQSYQAGQDNMQEAMNS